MRCDRIPASQVRALRLSAGLTQQKAAQVIGASRRAWQQWEGGQRNMPAAKFALWVMLVAPTATTSNPSQ